MATMMLRQVGSDPSPVLAGEGGVQRRFCRCGRPVFVRYRLRTDGEPVHGAGACGGADVAFCGSADRDWTAEFVFSRRPDGAPLCRCPACGRVLEIDGLR